MFGHSLPETQAAEAGLSNEIKVMARLQISLIALLLLFGACPVWALTIVATYRILGFIIPVLVLVGITLAIHHLFRNWRDGWAVAALLAGIVAWGALLISAIMSGAVSLPTFT